MTLFLPSLSLLPKQTHHEARSFYLRRAMTQQEKQSRRNDLFRRANIVDATRLFLDSVRWPS